MIKEIFKAKKNSIACIAIGDKFYNSWKKNIFPSWKLYCKKHDLGLIVFTKDLIDKKNDYWKKPTWQRCLVGAKVKENFPVVQNICVMDIDILINPYSPNIFNKFNSQKINLTSLRKNLPYDYDFVTRKLAYFRNKLLDPNYPLDSFLHCSLKTLYKFEKLPVQDDELNVGVMVFNLKKYAKKIEGWFFNYKKGIDTTTLGGCQTILNYYIQKDNLHSLIDYKFNAIWVFEIAERFPYILGNLTNIQLLRKFILSVLFDIYFLHFAGSGSEASVWQKKILIKKDDFKLLNKIDIYKNTKLKGLPKIKINN